MRVYEVNAFGKPKDKRFSTFSILAASDRVWDYLVSTGDIFTGIAFKGKWRPQRFYIERPLIPKPDFFGINASLLICNQKAVSAAGGPLEMSGQVLPIEVEGEKEKYWLYVPTNVINVVDERKSKWERLSRESRVLKKPAFFADRFGEETLFKIPQDRGASIYCVEHTGDADDGEFKALVEHHGLTGLCFELVWADETKKRGKAGTRRK